MELNHRCLKPDVDATEPIITKDMEVSLSSMHLSLFVEDQNGNDITFPSDPSLDFSRNSSRNSPDDMETKEDCISDFISSSSIIKKVDVHVSTINCQKTVDDNCNQNMTCMICNLKKSNIGSKRTTENVCGHFVGKSCDEVSKTCTNSDVQQAFVIGSEPLSRSGEKYSSVSSGEMLIRSNSFIIHEPDQILSASFLDETSDMTSDVGMMPDLLPDVCEGLVNNMGSAPELNNKNPDFGVTFIQPSNQTFTMEEEVFQTVFTNVPVASKASHSIGGVNHIECVTPVNLKRTPIESVSAERKAFRIPTTEELDNSGNAKTSTPVQSLSSKTFCLTESPLNTTKSDFGSPADQVMKKRHDSVSQNPKTSLMASTKSTRLETKKYTKPDFSNVKSKIISKPTTVFKQSSVAVISASSNVKQPKNLTRPSYSTAFTKATTTMSSNSTVTCSSLKKEQNMIKRTQSSDNAPAQMFPPRTWSETSNTSKTNEENKAINKSQVSRVRNASTSEKGSTVGGFLSRMSLNKLGDRQAPKREEKCLTKHQKSSSNADTSRPVGAALCAWRKSSLGTQLMSSRAGGASPAQTPTAKLRPPPLSASKLKSGTTRKNACTTSDILSPSLRSQLSTSGVKPSMRVTEIAGTEGSGGTVSKSSLTAGQSNSSASKLPMKIGIQPKNSVAANGHAKPGNKSISSLSHTPGRSASNISKMPAFSRLARVSASVSVDKSKAKGSTQNQQQSHVNGHPDLVPPETKPRGLQYYKVLCEKKSQTIQQLKNGFTTSNRRFEAIAIVVQSLHKQNEESVKLRQEQAVELLNLREELVSSVQSCERLEKEKEELHAAFDGVLQKVQEEHRLDLADLEERLKTFYTTEWEKIQQSYQDEAEKYKALMEQQLEEVRAKHVALQKDLEKIYEEKVQSLKRQQENSFEELRKFHEQEIQGLEKMQKDTETILSNQIEELTKTNSYFSERLKVEEDRRKELAEKCQKDTHALYLEQELESLKVVLDIKNKQIHQQDKKLLQLDKMIEKNVNLEDCLKKVQQENEELKARMDRHVELSRQLSTEQAVLQETLQKETKVNKRLSMENEELMWKLQNGDLSSPRKVSPSSPSVSLQSPRHSGFYTSPPISPR